MGRYFPKMIKESGKNTVRENTTLWKLLLLHLVSIIIIICFCGQTLTMYVIEFNSWKDKCTGFTSKEEAYNTFQQMGLEYGPNFQGTFISISS